MQNNPAIVISAYNRPHSLKRLLHALERAAYGDDEITLVISIDKSDVPEVRALAEAFEWKQGTKKIIIHPEHLGLKAHILKCGALTLIYQSIILLEDDLLVSPYFYGYSKKALDFYHNDPGIAGISLYNYQVAESCFHPFTALDDGSDVYFMQVASSWGQLWTKAQWSAFAAWHDKHPGLSQLQDIPDYIGTWGPQSWKKHFIHYLIDTDKYFVFPRLSLTTNFEDAGTHATRDVFQVALQAAPKTYQFKSRHDSSSLYDGWFELLPQCLSKLNPDLRGFDYSVDLYGTKVPSALESKYILSTRSGKNPLLSFGAELFPAEANVAMKLQGQGMGLYEIKDNVFTDKPLPVCDKIQPDKNESLISIVIPVETDDTAALKATLDSVALQSYGNKICIVVGNAGAMDAVKKITETYTVDIKIISVSVSALAELTIQGLNSAGNGLISWAMPGSTFATGAFTKAASVFDNNTGVSWIRGIGENIPDGQNYEKLSTARYRLTPGIAYRQLKNKKLDVGTELDFFRTHCVKNSVAEASFSNLFFGLISKYQLIIVVDRLGTKKISVPVPLADSERNRLLKTYAHFNTAADWQKSFFSFLLRTFFSNKHSFQWIEAGLYHLPDVLRYDKVNQTFYFHKY